MRVDNLGCRLPINGNCFDLILYTHDHHISKFRRLVPATGLMRNSRRTACDLADLRQEIQSPLIMREAPRMTRRMLKAARAAIYREAIWCNGAACGVRRRLTVP